MGSKNYAYTSLSAKDSVKLTIDGKEFEVVQFSANFAINEIPEALCMLAVGRDARDVNKPAAANRDAAGLKAMKKAMVTFKPDGEYAPDGTAWPSDDVVLFDGYFTGFSYVKANGKVSLVAHLIHWLADLGFTSTLNAVTHPPNPASLAFAGINEMVSGSGTLQSPGAFIGTLVGHEDVKDKLAGGDLWGALKSLFCGMAFFEGFSPGEGLSLPGVDIQQLRVNTRARKALKAIEGLGDGRCAFNSPNSKGGYEYGKKLTLTLPAQQDAAYDGISDAICHVLAAEMAQHTLWDAMIGYYCPMFAIDLWPMVSRAVVAASLPGYRGNPWQTITPDEYDYIDQTSMLPKPLRGVICHGAFIWQAGAGSSATSGIPTLAGYYAPKNAGEDGDGAVMYIQMPPWIGGIVHGSEMGPDLVTKASSTASSPGKGDKRKLTSGEMIRTANDMANKFAQSVFVQNALRGRSGSLSGKLRFDIGPGSLLKLIASPELFLGGEDKLAEDLFCQVTRVSVEINAESRRAATSMVVAHQRNKTENADDRTSIDAHPFFGDNIAIGAPLIDKYKFKAGS